MSAARRARATRLLALAGWSALLAGAWSAGEVAGYLCGAGRSPRRWQ